MSRSPGGRTALTLDPVSEALNAARARSAIVLNDGYWEPWGIAVPDGSELATLVGAGPDDLVAVFHVVAHGSAYVERDRRRWDLGDGDVLISFAPIEHVLGGGDLRRAPTPMRDLLDGPNRLGGGAAPSDPPDTEMLCGVFLLERVTATALGRWLPPVLHVPAPPEATTNLALQLRFECRTQAPGAQFSISRLLELLLGDALRSYCDTELGGVCSLDAACDEVVWQAVRFVTRDPGRAWTVEDLALACAVSPSTLAERFQAAVGRAPMRYLTQWRMSLAADLLEHSALSVERIAHRVGYSNQPAFSRAFKRAFATTPSDWRDTRRHHPHTR